MTSPDANARPSQVTLAGWAAVIASVLLVLAVFDAMSGLNSLATRDRLTEAVSGKSFQDLGITVDDALGIMRWAILVTGAAAAAAAILGFFVLQRNKGARIGLTVAAVPIVLAAPLTGSFLGMFVGAGAAVLWSRPARDWFAGRAPTPPAARITPPAPTPPPDVAPWQPPVPPTPGAQQPPPMPGWGQAPPAPGPPGPVPMAGPPPQQAAPSAMPRQVRTACLLTWIFSGITALLWVAFLVVLAVDSEPLLTAVKDTPTWDARFDDDVLTTALVVTSVFFLLWCVAASVLAVFVWRRAYAAWILLAVCVGAAALVSALAFPVSLVHLVAASFTTGMLVTKPSRDWFAGR
ncbi:hypothetical protein EFK50_19150 [Nocardioides marmoriginsengisoli]|uniref:DUF4064 domain-containing protein n=1 Tax=Nocardioides marmoriginsengisoli TaxID=661483 RepID=A0A3N0CBK9_9ACTN|nr:hypothetical protein [Nocardioides marmoriginsengisoli]RNL60446.1 hypothetical protein EFK50_19150 [Nocardioides marmoriginsengisoli]